MKLKTVGFTLVEVLVVSALIAILAGTIYANVSDAGAQSRDAERQADLRNLQNAIELYKQRHGRYPAGCNGTAWSGELGSGYPCDDGSGQYIVGLAPAFISVLPKDPKLNPDETHSGYMYRTNTEGTVYKIMAANTVETETIVKTDNHPFKSCDVTSSGSGVCDATNDPGLASGCDNTVKLKFSYGLWGGFADPANVGGGGSIEDKIEKGTEMVICEMP